MNIGPQIYDAFYYTYPPPLYSERIIAIMLMEKFDTDVENYLAKDINHMGNLLRPQAIAEKKSVCSQMIELLKKMVSNNLFCGDIRSDNFVMNKKPLKIRIIDFGDKFCSINTAASAVPIFLHIVIISLFFNCNHILQEPSRWGTSQKSTGTHEPTINKIILQPFIPYLNTICMKEEEEKIISYLLNPAQNALYQTFIWNILSYDADSKENHTSDLYTAPTSIKVTI